MSDERGPGTGRWDVGDLGADEAVLARQRRRRTVRLVGAAVLGAAALGAVVLAWPSVVGRDDPGSLAATESVPTSTPSTTTLAPSATTGPSPTTAPGPTPTPEPVTSPDPATTAMPLKALTGRFAGVTSIVSDTPDVADRLEDGDYLGFLRGVDAAARTVSVDIGIFYGGAAADEYVRVNEPEFWAAEGGVVPNDYWIVNEVERVREIPVSPGVAIATWCFATDSGVDVMLRDFDQWAAVTTGSEAVDCDEVDPAVRQGNDLYWFDVRGGMVLQIVGQYLP